MTESAARDLTTLAVVLAAIPEVAVAIDSNDRVAACNPAALALLPMLRTGGLLATHLRSPDILDAVAAARTRGEASASWSERAPVERQFAVTATAVTSLGCGPLVIVHLRETSDLRRVERMRVDFVANASHELRTPLASLLGFIETLQGSARNDEAARGRFLDIMRQQARRMARLVDDLLSLSRIEGHLHLRPKDSVDLEAVLRHVGDTLAPLAGDSGVDLCLEIAGPISVPGDRDELLRVAENLIENAIKYGAADARDRRVVVSAARAGGEAVVTVRDFGGGIAAEHIPRLTERFYRVDAGQSRARGGTGLGLAIVKHVVARHRGRLKVQSTRGQGAVFQVFLPLSAENRPDAATRLGWRSPMS